MKDFSPGSMRQVSLYDEFQNDIKTPEADKVFLIGNGYNKVMQIIKSKHDD